MTRRRLSRVVLAILVVIASGVAWAQRWWPRTPPGVIPDDRAGVPNWKTDERFKHDVFTFVRVEYDSGSFRGWDGGGRRRGRGGGWGWATDWPDSDLNFSFRLQ